MIKQMLFGCTFAILFNACRPIHPDVSTTKLIGGVDTFDNWEVGKIVVTAHPEELICTATLISESLILSASHCMHDPSCEGKKCSIYQYYNGEIGQTYSFVVEHNASEQYSFPISREKSFGKDVGEDDVALAWLSIKVPIEVAVPALVASALPSPDREINRFGYGCIDYVFTDKIPGGGYESTTGTGIKRIIREHTSTHKYRACPGDSGGPVMTADTREVYAVNSASTVMTKGLDGKLQPATIDHKRAFINPITGGNWDIFGNVVKFRDQIEDARLRSISKQK